jgi:hypothetical protein
LANRQPIALSEIRRMADYFARHAEDRASATWDDARPSNVKIGWLLWGGDAGREWANRILEKSEAMA